VCVCERLEMDLINFQLLRPPEDFLFVCACVCVCCGVTGRKEVVCERGLSRKAIKPFKSHKVLGQSKPPPARLLMSSMLCMCKCTK